MVMSQDKRAGQSHNVKTDNSSFERMEEFRYLGTTLTNQNSIQEENKCRLKSQNACYHSVQNAIFKTAYLKIYNSSSERAEEFKYLGTTLTNQNSI
jgi:UDP-galactopyranose mutase